jgi:protoheme IX farnesyltransferase
LEGVERRAHVLGSLVALTKPRLSTLSVMTAVVAYAAARPPWDWSQALGMVVGTGMAAGGALTLNQWYERDTDCIMERTRDRPLPDGQVTPALALASGLGLSILGTLLLGVGVNMLSALLAAATIVSYVWIYTPLKHRTRWATEVGAIPGALPPLLGWAAAEGTITTLGWALFAVLLFWQMPHFFAIGWVYREDYRAAGFPLLPVVDPSGFATAAWSLAHALALLAVSLVPWWLGLAGAVYGVGALVGGLGFVGLAMMFFGSRGVLARTRAARWLFAGSLLYLPVVFTCLLIDRLA